MNASLYDKLLALNTLPGARERWADYRAALTEFVCENTEEGASLHVCGAGVCHDIDLGRLAARAGELLLSDMDTDAVFAGVREQDAGSVRICRLDYLGIPAESYRRFDAELLSSVRSGQSGRETGELFIRRMREMLENAAADSLPKADTVVSSGVHSQLLAMFPRMASVYARYTDLPLGAIYEAVRRENEIYMPLFTERLLASANKRLVFGLETGREGTPGGIEGAAEALRYIENLPVVSEKELLWPLDPSQGKLYRVKLICIDTEKGGNHGVF